MLDLVDYQAKPERFGIELLGEHYTDDVINVMRSVRDNPITIAISANATGKSHGAARIATWFYKCYPDAQVYTTSAPPEKNLRRILWGELYGIFNKHPSLFADDRITGDLHIQQSPQSFITGVAIPSAGSAAQREAKFSGKHAPNLLFIVDEGDAVPPEVYKGIESCMSGGNARLLVMFNPRAEIGTVANMIRQKRANVVQLSAFKHPNVITGQDQIPGAVNREKTVRRINEWTEPLLPDDIRDNECFEVPEFLVGTIAMNTNGEPFPPLPAGWRRVLEPQFFYMVLGQYPPQSETQLISQAWLDAAVMRWKTYVAQFGQKPPLNITPIIGMDIADMGKDSNQVCTRYGGFVLPLVGWRGMDTDATAIKAADNFSNLNAPKGSLKIMVDATGVGSSVAPRLRRLGYGKAESIYVASSPTYEVEGKGEFAQMRDQLWWSVREWLRADPGAMLPPDDDLLVELHTPLYAVHNGKIKISNKDTIREMLGRSPDKADALCMTFAPKAMTAGAFR